MHYLRDKRQNYSIQSLHRESGRGGLLESWVSEALWLCKSGDGALSRKRSDEGRGPGGQWGRRSSDLQQTAGHPQSSVPGIYTFPLPSSQYYVDRDKFNPPFPISFPSLCERIPCCPSFLRWKLQEWRGREANKSIAPFTGLHTKQNDACVR